MGYVYRISAPGSNRVYIGQSIEPCVRWEQHKRLARAGTHKNVLLARFLLKHKDAIFIYWPVDDTLMSERKYELEMREAGFDIMNLIPCGLPTPLTHGYKHTEQAKLKMSAARRGISKTLEHRRKIAAGRTGKHHTLETRLKMSTSHKRGLY